MDLKETKHILTSTLLDEIIVKHREKVAKKAEVSTFQLQMHYKFNNVIPFAENKRTFLFVSDLRDLIKAAISNSDGHYNSRWCRLSNIQNITKVITIFIEDATELDYDKNQDFFPFVHSYFQTKMSLINPETYSYSFEQEFFYFQNNLIDDKLKNLSRVDLVLSPDDLRHEEFALPFYNQEFQKDFLFSHEHYLPISDSSPLFSIDCEMVETSEGKELAWIAVVNEDLECVYQTYVKPDNVITNYLTKYSGITKKILYRVKTKLNDVQYNLKQIIPSNAILVGHSLKYDLYALKIFHPYIIDTSTIFNLSNDKFKKPKLKELAAIFLNQEIQSDSDNGHNPKEDAIVTMKLLISKLQHGIEYGDVTKGWTMYDLIKNKSPELNMSNENNQISKEINKISKNNVSHKPVLDSCELNINCSSCKPLHNFVQNLSRSSTLFKFSNQINKKIVSVGVCSCLFRGDTCHTKLRNKHINRIYKAILGQEPSYCFDNLFVFVSSINHNDDKDKKSPVVSTTDLKSSCLINSSSNGDGDSSNKKSKKSRLNHEAFPNLVQVNNCSNNFHSNNDKILHVGIECVNKKETSSVGRQRKLKRKLDNSNISQDSSDEHLDKCKLVLSSDVLSDEQDLLIIKLRMSTKLVEDNENNKIKVPDYLKLDMNIQHILKDIPLNTLVVLTFNGMNQINGKCFIKLTD